MTDLATALAGRLRLLGVEPAGLLLLLVDLALVASLAGLVAGRARIARRGSVRWLLAVGLVAFTAVVAPATALGALGALSNRGLVGSHVVLLALAVATGPGGWRSTLGQAWRSPLELAAELARIPARLGHRSSWRAGRCAESALLTAILALLAFDAVLALGTLPLSYDSQTYRLSRAALWLESGSIAHFPSNDARLSYVGQNADLLMAWLISFFRRGYPLVHLVQLAGGLLACGAVHELAARLGFRRFWRLAAIAVLLGVPTAGIQFFTSQTDLFVAGALAAGLVFALAALRSGRLADWLFAGVGAGLALGAKGTVFYFAPGLLLLLIAELVLVGGSLRRAWRGAALALIPVAVLSGLNFWQNYREFGNPLAPPAMVRGLHGPGRTPEHKTLLNWTRMTWQVFEPASNPLLPEAIRAPIFVRLSRLSTELAPTDRFWKRNLDFMDGRLDEDHASFGVIFMLAVLAGGTVALARAVRAPRRRWRSAAAMFGGVGAFFAYFLWQSTMNAHQFRYFVIAAPLAAVVAVAPFAFGRSRRVAAIGSAFVVVQLAAAAHVSVRSEYHGWRALLQPETSTHYPLWRDARGAVASLPESVRRVGIALPHDSWLAPFLRTGQPHDVGVVPFDAIARLGSAGKFLAIEGFDALVVDAEQLPARWKLDDVRALPAPWILRASRLALVPATPAAGPRPTLLYADGLFPTGWTRTRSRFEIAAWSTERFALELHNPSPLARRIVAVSSRERRPFEVPAQATFDLELAVAPRDAVRLEVSPPFVPARDTPPSADRRQLGVLVRPSSITAREGVFADGWTEPRARFGLVNWVSGGFDPVLSNPTPLPRRVVARGRLGEARLDLAPGGSGRLELAVLPIDEVTLEVTPPFVPAAASPTSTDSRELGVLLDPLLLRPPAAGEYR